MSEQWFAKSRDGTHWYQNFGFHSHTIPPAFQDKQVTLMRLLLQIERRAGNCEDRIPSPCLPQNY